MTSYVLEDDAQGERSKLTTQDEHAIAFMAALKGEVAEVKATCPNCNDDAERLCLTCYGEQEVSRPARLHPADVETLARYGVTAPAAALPEAPRR